MLRRPPGDKVVGNKLILALVLLLASAWIVDAQPPQQPSGALRKRAESPHENDGLHTIGATRLAHMIDTPHGSDRRKSTLSSDVTGQQTKEEDEEYDASAIATLAPADRAVRAPITKRSSTPDAGLAPPQDARDLGDWEVEEIVLLATVDGRLYCRHRRTGQELWTLEVETPMVEATYHNRNRTSLEDGYLPIDHYLWVVEPSSDGNIFIYIPSGSQGLVNTGLTMKKLVEDLAPYSDGNTEVLYTGEKKTTMVTVDAHTGRVLKWFGAGGALVNDEASCSASNGLLGPDSSKCSTRGTLTLGRTEYRVDIHGKFDGHPIATLKYSEWQPNNFDQDLMRQYRFSKDGRYVYARHDGGVFAADVTPDRDPKRIFTQKFSSPVARVYDVIRPWGSEDQSPDLVILEQPIPPAGEETLPGRRNRIFLNHTEDGSWYAMSGVTYPSVVTGSQPAICDSRDWWHPGRSWEDMKDSDLSKALVGLHTIDAKTVRSDPLLTIGGPRAEESLDVDSNISAVIPLEPEPSSIVQSIRDLPTTAATQIIDFIKNPVVYILLILLVVWKWKDIGRYAGTTFKLRGETSEPEKPAQGMSTQENQPPTIQETTTAPTLVEGSIVKEVKVKAADLLPPPTADSVARAIGLDDELTPVPEATASPVEAIKHVLLEAELEKIPPTPEKKKAHRGKRGGVKHKKPKKENSSSSDDKLTGKLPTTVEEAVRDAQKLGDQGQRAIEPDVQTLPNGVAEVSGPVLRLGSLEVNTEKLIGTGSNGTMVFEGKFDGRDVAVKRMLIQFYDIASQETKLLRESDNHENVIRYYAQQNSAGFLYIALELCPASLADVIDKPHNHRELAQEGEKDLPRVLYQITNGLQHLHDLRIVHRDLKPQNILVKMGKNGKPQLLVSDFGLCKKLEGEQSSFRATTAHAAGTSGWRAPELLLDDDIRDGSRIAIDASDPHTQHSGPLVSTDMLPSRRATRAIDIFSLGLVFFYVLTKGSHPFDCGDRYMREVNIRKNKFNLEPLEVLGDFYFEAKELIGSMLDPDPKCRPSARDVLAHPFFWSARKRLAFLCDVSDHFEKEIRDPPSAALQDLEYYAPEVIYDGDFLKALGKDFVESLGKQRKYTGGKMLDLMRALRNKKNHYEDMSPSLRANVGSMPEGYLSYWTRRFPNLLVVCWEVVYHVKWDKEERFREYYEVASL